MLTISPMPPEVTDIALVDSSARPDASWLLVTDVSTLAGRLRFPSLWQDFHAHEAVVSNELSHHLVARAAGGELELHDGTRRRVRFEMAKAATVFAIHVN